MTDAIATLRAEWNTLKLELSVPANLRRDDFEAVLLARKNPVDDVYRARLPMSVACLKDEVQKEMMGFEDSFKSTTSDDCRKVERKYQEAYIRDIDKINLVLFRANALSYFFPEMRLRTQTSAYVGNIHTDWGEPHYALYLARVSALPVLCISGKKDMEASDEVRALIKEGSYGAGPEREPARKKLREMKILEPLPLGDIGLLLTRPHYDPPDLGTKHCSSPVAPGKEIFSGMFRAFGKMSPQNV